jgi:hypothetical protein
MWEAVFLVKAGYDTARGVTLQKMYFETEDDCWVFANWLSEEDLGYVVAVNARETA